MKILHVIPSVSPVRGGPSQAALEFVAAQRRRGVDAEIATTNDDGPELLEVPFGELVEYGEVPVRFFPRWSPPMRALKEFAFSAALTGWLWRHVGDYHLVHVHALFSYPSSVAMLICRIMNRPYLNSPHGLLCTWSMQQSVLRKRAYLGVMERGNLNASAGIEYATEQEREEAAPLGLKAPALLMPFGLHMPAPIPGARQRLREKFGLPEERPVILFLSRLHPKKGLEILLDALEKMVDVDFTLIAAGSGDPDYEAALRARIEGGPLAGRVLLPGFVQGEEKNLLFQGADVFALTSHSESLGIAALEALAAGIPALITPGVPLASVVREQDLGAVVAMDVGEIEEGMRRLLKTPRTGADAARARQFVETNFAWDVIARQSAEAYLAVLRGQMVNSREAGASA